MYGTVPVYVRILVDKQSVMYGTSTYYNFRIAFSSKVIRNAMMDSISLPHNAMVSIIAFFLWPFKNTWLLRSGEEEDEELVDVSDEARHEVVISNEYTLNMEPCCDVMEFGEVRYGSHFTDDKPLVHKITNTNTTEDMRGLDAKIRKCPTIVNPIPMVASYTIHSLKLVPNVVFIT